MNKIKKQYVELYEVAERARELSYSPYSGITVGAALLGKSGKIYVGANIENASYSPTVCAERTAIFKAVLEGEREFVAIAIAGGACGEDGKDGFYPCGVCRQVMSEFFSRDTDIITKKGDDIEITSFAEALPMAFTKDKL